MRGAIEQSSDLADASIASIMTTGLTAARQSLLVALDFDHQDVWTICIYEASTDPESGKVALCCIAHDRTVPCKLSEARVWQGGDGVVGIAYSTAMEKIIPDMSTPGLGTAYTSVSNARSSDQERYLSFAAIPILVGNNKIPWGVAVATSNQPDHFYSRARTKLRRPKSVRVQQAMARPAAGRHLAKRSVSTVASPISGRRWRRGREVIASVTLRT